MRISTKHVDPNAPTDFTLRDAAGCLRFALGVLAGIIGFLFLTTAPSAVNAWIHRGGYRPTEVVFSTLALGTAKIEIVSTVEELSKKKSKLDFEFVEGPRTVLYNPEARVMVAGLELFDDRIIVRLDRDFPQDAVLTTSATMAFLSAAWLLLGFHKRERRKRQRA